jgi:hypothetical protein
MGGIVGGGARYGDGEGARGCGEGGEYHFGGGGGFTTTRVVVIKELSEFTEPSSSGSRDSL